MQPYNYTERKAHFDKWQEFIAAGTSPETTVLATLNFNFNTRKKRKKKLKLPQFMPGSLAQIAYGERTLDYFGYRIDRALYGKKFHLLPRNQRTSFIACPEHLESNFHYHGVFVTPDAEGFKAIANRVWQEIVPSGDLFFKEDEAVTDQYIWNHSGYQLKELWDGADSSHYFISRVGNKAAH